MRRSLVLGVVLSLFVLATPVYAVEPVVVVDEAFSGDETIAAGEICDFAVHLVDSGHERITQFFNQEGDLVKVTIHVRGTSHWSGPGGTATEHWSWNGTFDPETLTFTQAGNVWNLHMGQGGTILQDKGRIVRDVANDEAIRINGPHEVFEQGLGALCEAIG